MSHNITITLPDEVYQPLIAAAERQGRTPEELVAEHLAGLVASRPPAAPGENDKADITRFFGAASLGHATGTDNDRIDADLAREYGATHERQD